MKVPYASKLSKGERKYKNMLMSGINDEIDYAVDWLGSDEYYEMMEMGEFDARENWDSFSLDSYMKEVVRNQSDKVETHIGEFYGMGSAIGCAVIGKRYVKTYADTISLNELIDYNQELIQNLYDEVRFGIKETVLGEITNAHRSLASFGARLIEIPYNPLNIGNTHQLSPQSRAEVISRTEFSRAVNSGTLQSYANYGIEEFDIITAEDSLVCEDCEDFSNNNPYSLGEIGEILPVHPNCRCGIVPRMPPKLELLDEPPIVSLVE